MISYGYWITHFAYVMIMIYTAMICYYWSHTLFTLRLRSDVLVFSLTLLPSNILRYDYYLVWLLVHLLAPVGLNLHSISVMGCLYTFQYVLVWLYALTIFTYKKGLLSIKCVVEIYLKNQFNLLSINVQYMIFRIQQMIKEWYIKKKRVYCVNFIY